MKQRSYIQNKTIPIIRNLTLNTQELYKRPGIIQNKEIAEWKRGIIGLKPNLREVSIENLNLL